MEPQEIDSYLFNNSLRGLIFFTGLDLSGSNAQHSAIFNAFNDPKRERTMQFQYKILTAENELFQRRDSSIQQQNERSSESPALLRRSSQFHGIIKRRWPHKYLENRPALIVAFTDLDWDSPAWFEKRTECESKINTLRQSIGQREIRLALVLVQHQKTSLEDPVAAEKAMEMCQHCRLSSRLLFVFPLLTDPRATFECVSRLEMSFNEIAQDAYQATFKRIRARNVPNNDQSLLLRQQFKLAFISELREDRHSALRYYKQAYQICAELNVPDVDVYEIFTVASLLNYKICELNFLLNSPVEALNQFRKQAANFFSRQPGVYPSRELAAIEFYWWASQQCRIFAEIFNRAVTNGLAAYASQNPGRFLEEAATYYKKANSLVRQLRQRLAIGENQQQRQTPPPIGSDPLQSFDLNAPVLYFGQRPWRTPNGIAIRASSEPNTRPGGMLAPILGNPQLIEHAAKQFLEKNVRENYAHTLQLFSTAITQFKRYHCDRFATLAYLDMADEYIASRQFAKALQILHHLSIEFRSTSFHPFLRNVLIKAFNTAFCVCNLDEWIWALAQLLPSKLWDEKNATTGSLTAAEEIQEDVWLAAEKYLRGEFKTPFPIHHNDLFPKEEAQIDSARQIWHQIDQQAPTPTPSQPQQFKLDLSQFGKDAFLHCKVHFLTFADGKESPPQIIHAGEPLLIEVILHNNSSVPLCFQRCSLVLEQFSIATGKNSLILDDWHNAAGGKGEPITMASNGGNASLFFLFRPTLSQIFASQQQPQSRAQSPSVPNKRCELDISIRLFSIDSSNGTFFWDFEQASSNLTKGPIAQTNSLTIKVVPQLKEIKLSRTGFCTASENIRLFTDESIDLAFTLENSGNASEDLKNVRILCHKVYREEEFNQLPNTPMVQHTFAAPCNIPSGNPPISHQNEFSTGHTLVPIFNQEIATFLGQGESTDFSVRLQSKSNNCIALQFQICSQLAANGEPVEWVENFPIICTEPFKMETTVCCENGQRAQCLVGGQKYRIEVGIESTTNSVKILDVQWKLNASSIQKPLSAILASHFENLSISSAKDSQKNRKEIWIRLPNSEGIHDETQMALGDVVVEWSSSNSSEPIRSLFNIGQLPIGSSPINIQVEFLQQQEKTATEVSDEFPFVVGRPFGLRFSLWNSMENMQPLAIQLCFDQVDGFIFSGIKEDYLTLMPDGEPHVFVQTIIALCPGQLAFPRPSIRCTNSLPGRPSFDFSHEELERLNRKIAANTFNALPTTIFVMP